MPDHSALTFYSFGVMTCLGAAGISPVSEQARSLTIIEAILGILYLGVLVSRLIAMYRPAEAPSQPGRSIGQHPFPSADAIATGGRSRSPAAQKKLGVEFSKLSQTRYEAGDEGMRLVCAVSNYWHVVIQRKEDRFILRLLGALDGPDLSSLIAPANAFTSSA
ncbi:MAG TPA: hypothetical protein VGM27_05425 [Acidobacteriaceae bacterium]